VKHKPKHTSNLYQFLEQKGVLTNGTDAEIKAAKAEYRKIYQANWRRRQRHTSKEITITLAPDELKTISQASKKHNRSKTRFLKEATLAYINKRYLAPAPLTLLYIQEQLALNYSVLQKLFEEQIVPWDIGKELLRRMAELEHTILSKLNNPPEYGNQVH
jgi:hypothetical protein